MQTAKEENAQRRLVGRPTGEVLVDMGLLTQEQVDQAAAEQQRLASAHRRDRPGQGLGHQGRPHGGACPPPGRASTSTWPSPAIDPVALELISERDARRYSAIPVGFVDEHTVLVAMADPSNIVAIDDLRILTGFDIEPALASSDEIVEMLSKMRSVGGQLSEGLDTKVAAGEDDGRRRRHARHPGAGRRRPVVKLVNGVLARAADEGASDIHFEPQARDLLIRFRHDGVLHEIMTIPKRLQAGVISRLKIMADLDIAERRIPQDGRIGLTVGGRPIDMRVASLPTVYGEKIVIRLLDRSNVMLRLEDLGFSEQALTRYRRSFTKPYGAILVTGPDRIGQVHHALRHAQHPQHAPTRTSSPSKTRWNTGWPASTRCRSTPRPG